MNVAASEPPTAAISRIEKIGLLYFFEKIHMANSTPKIPPWLAKPLNPVISNDPLFQVNGKSISKG